MLSFLSGGIEPLKVVGFTRILLTDVFAAGGPLCWRFYVLLTCLQIAGAKNQENRGSEPCIESGLQVLIVSECGYKRNAQWPEEAGDKSWLNSMFEGLDYDVEMGEAQSYKPPKQHDL